MNSKQRALEVYRNMESTLGFHKFNCLRFHSESEKHLRAKFEKCVELWKAGHKFATEVRMKNGDIFDVIDLIDGFHWEFETNSKEDKKRGVRVQL